MLLLTPRVTGGEEARPARSATSVVTGSATSVVTNSATSVVIDSAICVDRGTVTFVVNSTDEFVGFNANHAEQSRALRVTQVPPPWPSPQPSSGDQEPFPRHHRSATSVFTSFVLVVSHPKRNIASFREMHRPTARGTWGRRLGRPFTKARLNLRARPGAARSAGAVFPALGAPVLPRRTGQAEAGSVPPARKPGAEGQQPLPSP